MSRALAPLVPLLIASAASAAPPAKPPPKEKAFECVLPEPEPRTVRRRPAPPPPVSLTRDAIMASIAGVRREVEACASTRADGFVTVRLRIAPSGAVSRVEIMKASTRRLGTCAAAALRRAWFPRTLDGASFVYPFRVESDRRHPRPPGR